MAPVFVEVWLFVIHRICARTLFGLSSLFNRNRLVLASVLSGYLLSLIVKTQAANTQVYTPVQTPTPEQNLAVDQVGGWFYFDNWVSRGMEIRSGPDVRQCLLNLAKALEEVEVLSSSEYNGAAGALSLLPTAGALLGAPTREMWIVYKLVPLAGILSMFLSLGATITPSDVGEYESSKAFSYGGLMPTVRTDVPQEHDANDSDAESFRQLSEAKQFARDVRVRADDDSGGDVHMKVWFGIAFQCLFIAIILIAMWFAQRGAVIPWWCRVWGWIFFWYFLVIVVSVFDNIVAAPFTHSWTIRVAKAPTKVMVDDTQSRITQFDRTRFPTIIDRLKAGVNLKHRITIAENDPTAYSRTCFYVIISVQGISSFHAFLQLISRGCSVAVFAFGTALFASATLMSISAALMLLCLVLPMAMMGRVVAMWIAAEMNKHNRSILHAVVKTKKEAGEHMEAIISLDGLQIETMGHIILDGNCITKRSPFFSAATYIGLLAKPYNLVRKAVKNQRQDSYQMGLLSSKSRSQSGFTGYTRADTGITQGRTAGGGGYGSRTPSGFEHVPQSAPETVEVRDKSNSRNQMFGPV